MNWNPFRRTERRSAGGYSQVILDAQLSAASAKSAGAAATAAIEAVAGLLSRTLAAADVAGDSAGVISPEWLALCGRELVRRGQHVSFVHPGPSLVPVGQINWEAESQQGELERDFRARITTYGPSSSRTRLVMRDQIIVIRWGTTSGRPYDGLAAHHFASLAARASAESERAAGDHSASPVASFLTVPEGTGQDDEIDTLAPLRESISTAAGRALVVESTASGYGEGRGNAPQRDFNPTGIGPAPEAAQVQATSDSFARMVAACGASVSLFSDADGTAQREALRRFHLFTCMPIKRLLEAELSRRLDSEIVITLDQYGADLAGRAQAFAKMVSAGMDMGKAAAISGVLAVDDG